MHIFNLCAYYITMQKARPEYYQNEQSILQDIEPGWKDPKDREAAKENKVNAQLTKEDIMSGIRDNLLDSTTGMGYLTAGHGGGYLRPPNLQRNGGFLPLIPILSGLGSLLLGSGMGKHGGTYHLQRSPNMASASSFFRDIAGQALEAGAPPELVKAKMIKLFGGTGMYNKVMRGKVGGAIQGDMKLGHLMAPVLMGHMRRALKNASLPPAMMSVIESKFSPFLDKPVTQEDLTKGGSILGSLWNGAKNILGKVVSGVKGFFGNKGVQDTASKILDSATGAIGKHAPKLIETAAEKLANYANKEMADDEPSEADIEKVQKELAKRKKEARAEKLLEEDEKRKSRRGRKRADDEDYEPSATRRFEQRPAEKSDTRRKELVRQRREKALVPYGQEEEEEEAPKQRKIVGYRYGEPIYGDGFGYGFRSKKKLSKKGGAWTVKLSRN
jgi:hypothetical protein